MYTFIIFRCSSAFVVSGEQPSFVLRQMTCSVCLFAFLLCLFAPQNYAAAAANNYVTVGSWNLKNFSRASRTDVEISLIALGVARFDLIALIEIRTDDVGLQVMKKILKTDFGLDYEVFVSGPIGDMKERYGFMWRTDKFAMDSGGFLFDDKSDDFVREPYCAPFKSLGGTAAPLKLLLCPIHAVFGETVVGRQTEAAKLPLVYNAAVKNKPSADYHVVLCGDYNLPPEDSGFMALKALKLTPVVTAPRKTTVGDVSLFDNFWLIDALLQKSSKTGVIFPFESYFLPPNSIDITKRVISDHRPVSISFDIDSTTWMAGSLPSLPPLNTTGGFAIGSWRVATTSSSSSGPTNTVLGVMALTFYRFAIVAVQGASMQDLDAVMTTLADDFKVGPFAYAIDGDAALVWRADLLSVTSKAARDATRGSPV